MLESSLFMPAEIYQAVWGHLLPHRARSETAAFMFVRRSSTDAARFEYVEWYAVPPDGFVSRSEYHLELTDETRAFVIKRAHDLEASIVEFHRHAGSRPAAFSPSDQAGFREFVPHVWWRLKDRPYLAVVVTDDTFDGLAWLDNPQSARPLSAIVVDEVTLSPTGASALRSEFHDAQLA